MVEIDLKTKRQQGKALKAAILRERNLFTRPVYWQDLVYIMLIMRHSTFDHEARTACIYKGNDNFFVVTSIERIVNKAQKTDMVYHTAV